MQETIGVEPLYHGPGVTEIGHEIKRNPYDISTWGPECARGFQKADQAIRHNSLDKRANRSASAAQMRMDRR